LAAEAPAAAATAPPTLGRAIEASTGCPRGRPGEIVVCRRGNASERYRIPEALRPNGFDYFQEDVDGVSRERHRLLEGRRKRDRFLLASGAAGSTGCLSKKFRAWEQQMAGH
jgi:hypothetical protein